MFVFFLNLLVLQASWGGDDSSFGSALQRPEDRNGPQVSSIFNSTMSYFVSLVWIYKVLVFVHRFDSKSTILERNCITFSCPCNAFCIALNVFRRSTDLLELTLQCCSILFSSSVIFAVLSKILLGTGWTRFFSKPRHSPSCILNHQRASDWYIKCFFCTVSCLLTPRYVMPTDRRWGKWRGVGDFLLVLVRWYSSPSGVCLK
jgi:hypothetical protein